jgi:hypothetical protein
MNQPPPVPPEPTTSGTPPTLPEGGPPARSRRVAPIIAAIAAVGVGALIAVPLLKLNSDKGADAALKAGWKRVAPSGEGFSLGLPPGWNSVSTRSADDAFNSLQSANPELANLVKDQLGASLSSLIKLLAFDIQSPTLQQRFATNLNVVVAPTGSGVSFDAFLEANIDQLRRTPGLGNTLRSEKISLPAGQAAKITSQLTVNSAGGQQTVAITQFLLVNEARGYIVSFSTLPSHVGSYSGLFQEIADTFRFA